MYFDLLSVISVAIDDGADKERILRRFKEFEKLIHFHFMSEENLMIESKYNDFNHHQRHHISCMDMIKSYLKDYELGKLNSMSVLTFLCDWFLVHISSHDKRFGEYLKSLPISELPVLVNMEAA
jgi:hemerythrin-like metal-binding protein